MGTSKTSSVQHGLKLRTLKESLLKECRVMVDHAMANGKPLDIHQIEPLEKDDSQITAKELLPVYNYLLMLVKPAKPGTLILFEKSRQSKNRFKFLGPLPIIRRFMLVSTLSLLALIAFSLSPDVNATSIELSMLQGSGVDQALRLGFLLAAASVGASFYALFRMNYFISQGTFDLKYSATYWSRYVVGLVAGILLSELFIVFINPQTVVTVNDHIKEDAGLSEEGILNTTRYLLKPILAIVGGFSASLVYRILNRLVEAIESLFKGSAEEQISKKQAEIVTQSQDTLNQVKSTTANHLLSLKNDLLNKGVDAELLGGLDSLTGSLVPTMANGLKESVNKVETAVTRTVPEIPVEEPAVAPEADEPAADVATEPMVEPAPLAEKKDDSQPTASW